MKGSSDQSSACDGSITSRGAFVEGTTQTGKHSILFLFKSIATLDIVLASLIAVSELIFATLPEIYIKVYNIYNMKGEVITTEVPHQTWKFLYVLILAMMWIILEGWMYETLCKGALELDSKRLNRWVNIRVIFLILIIIQTLYRIIELQFCTYDIIYTPIIMYRVLEIIFVKGLTVEICRAQFELNV